MATIDLTSLGKQIGASCAAGGSAADMNALIAKAASEKGLNREQTTRLVEEANKGCYLEHYRLTGQQCFDVASYDKVKEHLSPDDPAVDALDKCASDQSMSYAPMTSVLGVGRFGGPYRQQRMMVKAANDERLGHIASINNELREATEKFDGWIKKVAQHDTRMRSLDRDSAMAHIHKNHIKLAEAIAPIYERINKLQNDRNTLEKGANVPVDASVDKDAINVMAKSLKRANKVNIKFVGNAPELPSITHGGRTIGPNGAYTKTASVAPQVAAPFWQSVKNTFHEYAPKAALAAGVTAVGYAAKKLHDIYERRKEQKEMERNFDLVMQRDPALASNPNSRSYFDTISNFSPSLAKDPNTLSELLNHFNTFDGIDLNTVKTMRDIDRTDRQEFSLKIPGLDMKQKVG